MRRYNVQRSFFNVIRYNKRQSDIKDNYNKFKIIGYLHLLHQFSMLTKKQRKTSKQSGGWLKKYELMQQKILTNSRMVHNNFQYQIENLEKQLQQLTSSIRSQMKQLNQKVNIMATNYENKIEETAKCYESASSQTNLPLNESLTIDQIKKYLNTEKWVLQQLLQNKSSEPSSLQKIHNLYKHAELQQLLQQIKLKQIEREVHYLSTHVITGSGLIFVPESNAISEAEELQLNTKIETFMSQAQRLINMQTKCQNIEDGKQGKQHKMVQILQRQEERLNKVFDLLTKENESIHSIEHSISSWSDKLREIPRFGVVGKNRKISEKTKTKINDRELNCIREIKLEDYGDIVSNQSNQYQQIANSLRQFQNKLKKVI